MNESKFCESTCCTACSKIFSTKKLRIDINTEKYNSYLFTRNKLNSRLRFSHCQNCFLQQDSEDTCSVDELASERDETESEVASVSDTKEISDMEQDDGDDGGYHKMVEDAREHAVMRRSRGRTSSNLSGGMVLSPNSPTLSVGRLVL